VGCPAHLEVNRISSAEPIYSLSDGIVGMSIEDVEIGNSLSSEERTCYAAVESDGGHELVCKHGNYKITDFHMSPEQDYHGSEG
jgi:hypothetical protein